jgi:hypothetical protein
MKEHILPFNKWFQGSAVTIDGYPGGPPMVVYRGDSVNPGKIILDKEKCGILGTGIYFSDDRFVAEYFTDGTNPAHVSSFYLKMENPFCLSGKEMKDTPGWQSMMDTVPEKQDPYAVDHKKNLMKWANGDLDVKNTYGFLARSFGQEPETFNDFLKDHGFDGVVELGVGGVSDYGLQFVIFDPCQAKATREFGVIPEKWIEDDTDIKGIMEFLTKEIDGLPNSFEGVVKSIKLFGSYLRDKDQANDIDVHFNLDLDAKLPAGSWGPEDFSSVWEYIESWLDKKAFTRITGKPIDITMGAGNEQGMGVEHGKGLLLYDRDICVVPDNDVEQEFSGPGM